MTPPTRTPLSRSLSILHPQLQSCQLEEQQAAATDQADSGYKVLVMAVERLGKEMDRLHARLDRIAESKESRLTSEKGGGPRATSAVAPDKWKGPTEAIVMPDEPQPKAPKQRQMLPRNIRKAQQAVQSGDLVLD